MTGVQTCALPIYFDDMSQLYSKKEDMYLSMKYLGNTVYNALVLNYNGLGANARFVINDMDYEALKAGLKPDSLGTQVLFDSQESDGEIAFAKTLFRELVLGMSEEMNHLMAYNPMEEQRVGAENYVDMSVLAVVDLEEPAKETDWWYIPLLPESHPMTRASMAEKSATTKRHPSFGIKAVRINSESTFGVESYNNSISSNLPCFTRSLASSRSGMSFFGRFCICTFFPLHRPERFAP